MSCGGCPVPLLLKQPIAASRNPSHQDRCLGLPGAVCHLDWLCLGRERPLSPSSGPFCLLHHVPISHFKEMRQALATGAGRGSLLLFCPPAVTNQKCNLLLLGKSLFWGLPALQRGKSQSLGCQTSHRVSVTACCTGESSGHLQAPSLCGSPTLACLPVPEVTGTVTALGHPSVQSDVCLMVWDEQRVPSQ